MAAGGLPLKVGDPVKVVGRDDLKGVIKEQTAPDYFMVEFPFQPELVGCSSDRIAYDMEAR